VHRGEVDPGAVKILD